MFYSHQLLARKAPLGQIWMAATMHAKINRRKLDKLNIIQICEEILNPSVPMALRLSGILMGGVVIVYERKVKLLYEDVTRLLVEINEAWKVKAIPDPTVLPKGKSTAKYEAVTLPDNKETEVGGIEQSLHLSNTTTFQQTSYIAMRLDTLDEPYININLGEEDQHYHQADAANITIFEHFDPYQADAVPFDRFERFDIEGDDDTQANFAFGEHTQVPLTHIPSPPQVESPKDGPLPAPDEIQDQHPEQQLNQPSDEDREANKPQQTEQRQGPIRKKARRRVNIIMDYEQTMIPANIYQPWLRNTSDIVERRGQKRKRTDILSTMKIANLMELPPVLLSYELTENGNREIHYPAPILKLWLRSSQPAVESPSGRTSPPQPPEPSSPSALDRRSEEFQSSQSKEVSIEKQMRVSDINDISNEIHLLNTEVRLTQSNILVTPGNSGNRIGSNHSSESGQGSLSLHSESISGRSSKKRPLSTPRLSGGSGLEPVLEESFWENEGPTLKVRRSDIGLSSELELLVETGPTQTQQPNITQPIDKITDSIRMHLKTHFDTPGAPQAESLDQLVSGMVRKQAAQLFYQILVLVTRNCVRIQQKVAYGDIVISRGEKM